MQLVLSSSFYTLVAAAQAASSTIQITNFKIGSTPGTPTAAQLLPAGNFYSGGEPEMMVFPYISTDEICIVIAIPASVQLSSPVGSAMLYTDDGTAVASAAAPSAYTPTVFSSSVAGDYIFIDFLLHYPGIASVFDTSNLTLLQVDMVKSDDGTDLPDATAAMQRSYQIETESRTGLPMIYYKINGYLGYLADPFYRQVSDTRFGQAYGGTAGDNYEG